MHTRATRSSLAGRHRLLAALLLVGAVATPALAADKLREKTPCGDFYVVSAVLVPGLEGAEVLAIGEAENEVEFRVGFGTDLQLAVNGECGASFDPLAVYTVTVTCTRVCDDVWEADTVVVNETTGETEFLQCSHAMRAPAWVISSAEDAISLDCAVP